jgi:hypothetical protein
LLKGLFAITNHEDDKDGSGDYEKEHNQAMVRSWGGGRRGGCQCINRCTLQK